MRNEALMATLAMAFSFALAAPVSAQQAQTVTLNAQVIDLSCKIVQDASGPEHKMCAEVCADLGQPLGLLTADGQFYLPLNAAMATAGQNARLKPYAEQQVRVTGRVIERAGMKAIVMETIAGL